MSLSDFALSIVVIFLLVGTIFYKASTMPEDEIATTSNSYIAKN